MRKVTFLLFIGLVFTIPWEDSVSDLPLGSITRIAGFVVAAGWLATIALEGRFRRPHAFHGLVMLFILWNVIGIFWSLDLSGTMQRIKTYAQLLLLMLIAWELLRKPEELMAGLQAYIFGAYVLIISSLYNYFTGHIAVAYEGRYSATGVNAVDLALILMLGLPVAMQLFFSESGIKAGAFLRFINILYIPLAIFSIVLTGSRTSLIAIIPFGIFMAFSQQIRFGRKLFIVVSLLLFSLLLIPYVPTSILQRLGTLSTSIHSGDLGGRMNLWRNAIAMLGEHPLLGIGGGALDSVIGSAAHNTFISVATETGLIGFAVFCAALGVVLYQTFRLPRSSAGLWLAIFFTWVIGVMSLSWEFRKLTWLMLTFIAVEGSLLRESNQQKVEYQAHEHPGCASVLDASSDQSSGISWESGSHSA